MTNQTNEYELCQKYFYRFIGYGYHYNEAGNKLVEYGFSHSMIGEVIGHYKKNQAYGKYPSKKYSYPVSEPWHFEYDKFGNQTLPSYSKADIDAVKHLYTWEGDQVVAVPAVPAYFDGTVAETTKPDYVVEQVPMSSEDYLKMVMDTEDD